ncbi:MAG: dihydrodipicolinate reductase C-terminal domain-containing protein [Bacteroidales bacterium]|nr:dihydrodipicolinate reductase C-terminal domain-containing protein [Bacteroidales bacterium]
MNVFMKTADYLSQITADLGSFKVDISETHHIHKKDAPSGTAISLKEIVNKSYHNPDGIPIKSIREGEIIGIHSINFKSPLETITITHSLSSRDALAAGAIFVANRLIGKKGVFEIKDII